MERGSHSSFFGCRNWELVTDFWRAMVKSNNSFPSFIAGDQEYGLTDLQSLHLAGTAEFSSSNPKFKRKTFALRIGYDGSQYCGFQMQKGADCRTVEDDLREILGRATAASGRTDKEVSAVCQIVSFSTFESEVSSDSILARARAATSVAQGRLNIWECWRVPRQFHPLFTARWRRYIYLFPLNCGDFGEECVDVDVRFVNNSLSR
jgi:hypothetical protein